MNLSAHFTLAEFTASEYASRHGLDNTPNDEIIANLRDLAQDMERVREMLDHPIIITSGYRSPKVNAGIGSVPASAHLRGLACDFACPGFGTPLEVARIIYASGLIYDQLILEYGWVHFALAAEGKPYRRDVLTKRSAYASYERGLVA